VTEIAVRQKTMRPENHSKFSQPYDL